MKKTAEEQWEEVVDFTKIRRDGVDIKDLLKHLGPRKSNYPQRDWQEFRGC